MGAGSASWKMFGNSEERDGLSAGGGRLVVRLGG